MPRKRVRLTSIGGFGFGAGWEWVESDGEVVRRLLVFLEDRRALSYPHHQEVDYHVVESVLRIREEVVKTLQELAPDSGATYSVRALRDACLVFLDRVGPVPRYGWDAEFFVALGELRGVFAVYVRVLADNYGITVHGPLADVLHAADRADEESAELGT